MHLPQEYVPTVFETNDKTQPNPLDPSKSITLMLWDTAGQEDFDRIRSLAYPDTNVVLIIFAINHRVSMENITDKVSRVCFIAFQGGSELEDPSKADLDTRT
jgi:Rho family protein